MPELSIVQFRVHRLRKGHIIGAATENEEDALLILEPLILPDGKKIDDYVEKIDPPPNGELEGHLVWYERGKPLWRVKEDIEAIEHVGYANNSFDHVCSGIEWEVDMIGAAEVFKYDISDIIAMVKDRLDECEERDKKKSPNDDCFRHFILSVATVYEWEGYTDYSGEYDTSYGLVGLLDTKKLDTILAKKPEDVRPKEKDEDDNDSEVTDGEPAADPNGGVRASQT